MIQPVGPRMLVKPLPQKEIKLSEGIIIPDTANANLLSGEIVRLSLDEIPKADDGMPLYNKGDIVIYPNGSGTGHREGVEILLWLQHGEVWGLDIPENNEK